MSASTKATPGRPRASSTARGMPGVVIFDGDEAAARAIKGIQQYARVKSTAMHEHQAETIVVLSNERQLLERIADLRAPNVRVIAISDRPFHDPRADGAVYAYIPAGMPSALLERLMDNALDHIHLLATRRDVNQRLGEATREIQELNAIGAALSAEHNTEKLLEMILTKSREITRSDAGSLYLVEEIPLKEEEVKALPEQAEPAPEFAGAKLIITRKQIARKALRFKLAQNDSIAVPFREVVMDISDKSIAGYVAKTGESVNLEDAYHLSDNVSYHYNRKFDDDSGYRTMSMLAVPMRNAKGEIVGVVQLINAKRNWETKLTSPGMVIEQVLPYTLRQQDLVTSLASQAAVALENSRLYEAIQRMLEGFVRASVTAIEARDPTTSGHSFRVSNLTVALAEAADRSTDGPYKHLSFSRNQMREIRYAALLHDFGKVGVREEVLVKAKKLYPSQLELIKQRFQLVKRSMQLESTQAKLDYLLQKGRGEALPRLAEYDQQLAANLAEVDDYFATILKSNEPTLLAEGSFEKLLDIAERRFLDFDQQEQALLTPEEVRLLSIRRGSLDDAERRQIESHVVHTFNFLAQIPWTRELRNLPEIARSHHEKLTGQGYPYKLSAPEIPLQTRMMTISDIFDALAASDRPYKKAVSAEKALQILEMAVKDGELDPHLFQLFLDAKVWERWKTEPFPY